MWFCWRSHLWIWWIFWLWKKGSKFQPRTKIFESASKDYYFLLYATYHHLVKRKEDFDFCQDEEKFCEVFGRDFFKKLKSNKESLQLDSNLCTFGTICYIVNELLMEKKNYFCGFMSLEKYFNTWSKECQGGGGGWYSSKGPFSLCWEAFQPFWVGKKLTENSIRQNYKPMNLVDKPVSINQIINYTLLMFVGIFQESFKNLRTKTYKLLLLTWNL